VLVWALVLFSEKMYGDEFCLHMISIWCEVCWSHFFYFLCCSACTERFPSLSYGGARFKTAWISSSVVLQVCTIYCWLNLVWGCSLMKCFICSAIYLRPFGFCFSGGFRICVCQIWFRQLSCFDVNTYHFSIFPEAIDWKRSILICL